MHNYDIIWWLTSGRLIYVHILWKEWTWTVYFGRATQLTFWQPSFGWPYNNGSMGTVSGRLISRYIMTLWRHDVMVWSYSTAIQTFEEVGCVVIWLPFILPGHCISFWRTFFKAFLWYTFSLPSDYGRNCNRLLRSFGLKSVPQRCVAQ